jgi:hypothetical protein
MYFFGYITIFLLNRKLDTEVISLRPIIPKQCYIKIAVTLTDIYTLWLLIYSKIYLLTPLAPPVTVVG